MAIAINWLAVLVCVVFAMALGALWYGPLFGKQWMQMMGFTMESMDAAKKKGMAKSYIFMAIGALVMVFVLDHNLTFGSAYLHITGVSAGLQAGFWNWLGFVAPTTVGMVLWEGKPWKLWCIVAGYYLVSLLVMGVILAVWM